MKSEKYSCLLNVFWLFINYSIQTLKNSQRTTCMNYNINELISFLLIQGNIINKGQ